MKSMHVTTRTAVTLLSVLVMLGAGLVLVAEGSSAATDTFEITDGTGQTFTFDGPTEHVVTAGAGATLTVADAGQVAKIVAVDKYSTYGYTKYEQLEDLHAEDLGSFYGNTNHDYIITTLVKMVDAGTMSKDDAVILTSYTSNLQLREKLVESGFTHVLVWTSVADYEGIIDFVTAVSKVVTGTEPDSVKEMNSKIATVKQYASEHVGAKALYVSYSSKQLMVGNTGIMQTMLEICGANNLGYDPSKATNYGDTSTIVSLLQNDRDATVFVQNAYFSSGKTVDDFYEEVFGGDRSVKVVQMGLNWNNWCPESADGLYSIAQALYGENFDSDGSDEEKSDDDGSDNTVVIAAVAVVVVIVIVGAATYFVRKH